MSLRDIDMLDAGLTRGDVDWCPHCGRPIEAKMPPQPSARCTVPVPSRDGGEYCSEPCGNPEPCFDHSTPRERVRIDPRQTSFPFMSNAAVPVAIVGDESSIGWEAAHDRQ